MLPSFVSGSAKALIVISAQTVDAEVKLESSDPVAADVSGQISETVAPQTDEVLSQWDQQKWWDSAATGVAPAEKAETPVSASVGFLGALLALAPRSLRRRRKDQSST